MPKSKFKAGSKAQRKVRDLCCDQLEEQHEVLVCEGGCNSTVHHYCAGVTREHYAKLITDTEPFTCQCCMLRTYRAMVVQLQSDVENLKSELASMKATLQARTPERRTKTYQHKVRHLAMLKQRREGETSHPNILLLLEHNPNQGLSVTIHLPLFCMEWMIVPQAPLDRLT